MVGVRFRSVREEGGRDAQPEQAGGGVFFGIGREGRIEGSCHPVRFREGY